MTRQVKLQALSLSLVVGMSIAGVCWAADDLEGAARLDLIPSGGGPARARAVDLEPRLIGSTFFLWDNGAESGIGWQANVVQGEYVQAFNINGTLVSVIVCALGDPTTTARVAAVVYDDDGPGGGPGTLLAMSEATAIPGPATLPADCTEIPVPATERGGRTFVGASWMPSQDQGFFLAADESAATPIADMYGRGRTGAQPGPWSLVRNTPDFEDIRALGIGARVVSMAQATAPCFNSANVVCLTGGRFRVELKWRRPNDVEGLGTDSGLRTSDSDVMWFFNASNLEILIKVLNACTVNNRYWVFFAATTNVEFGLTVTDTQSGKIKTYFNPLGRPAPPVQDTSAFATCP